MFNLKEYLCGFCAVKVEGGKMHFNIQSVRITTL